MPFIIHIPPLLILYCNIYIAGSLGKFIYVIIRVSTACYFFLGSRSTEFPTGCFSAVLYIHPAIYRVFNVIRKPLSNIAIIHYCFYLRGGTATPAPHPVCYGYVWGQMIIHIHHAPCLLWQCIGWHVCVCYGYV